MTDVEWLPDTGDGGDPYDLGLLWDPNGVRDPLPVGASEEALIRAWWAAGFCYQQKFFVPHPDARERKVYLPPLLNWYRHDTLEVFEIEMRGKMRKYLPDLTGSLRTARYARQVTVTEIDGDPGAFKVVLNHAQLPDLLPFDVGKIPEDPDVFYLGQLSCGPDALIDFTEHPHMIIAGGTGSGKSELASLLLTQIHLKGGSIVLGTPTIGDANLSMFGELTDDAGELCHTVVAGSDREALQSLAEACSGLKDEIARRETAMGEAGDVIYQGNWLWLALDEIGWLIKPVSPDDGLNEFRQRIYLACLLVAQRGRKVRVGLMAMTQQPYAEELGGTLALMGQMYGRVAIRTLTPYFQDTMFNPDDAQKVTIRETLSGSASLPGRAIAKGVCEPTDPWFRGFPVQNQPMQVAYADKAARRVLLGLPVRPVGSTNQNECVDTTVDGGDVVDRIDEVVAEFDALGFDEHGRTNGTTGVGLDTQLTASITNARTRTFDRPSPSPQALGDRPRLRVVPEPAPEPGPVSLGDIGDDPNPSAGYGLEVDQVDDGGVIDHRYGFLAVHPFDPIAGFPSGAVAAASAVAGLGWLMLLVLWPAMDWVFRLGLVAYLQALQVAARHATYTHQLRPTGGLKLRGVLLAGAFAGVAAQLHDVALVRHVGMIAALGLLTADILREIGEYLPDPVTIPNRIGRRMHGIIVMTGVAAVTLVCTALLVGAGLSDGWW